MPGDVPPPPVGRPTNGQAAPRVVPTLTASHSKPAKGLEYPDITAGRVHLAAFLILMTIAWYHDE